MTLLNTYYYNTMNTCKILSLDYLINSELTEDDLYILFEEKAFNKSLIIAMFKHIGCKKLSNKQILHICKHNDKWFNKYIWSKSERDSFLEKITLVYKNVYQFGNVKSRQLAEWWLIRYGFRVKDNFFFEN